MSRLVQMRFAAFHARNSACWTSGRVPTLPSALTRVQRLRRMGHSPHRISASVSSDGGNARQAVPLFVKLKPRDTEVPSAGAIRASLLQLNVNSMFSPSEKKGDLGAEVENTSRRMML